MGSARGLESLCRQSQYSPLITKYEPRIVPASFDFCLANLNASELCGDVHAVGELESDGPLLGVVEWRTSR